MWEGGLKLGKPKGAHTLALSLLMWECGLKHAHRNIYKLNRRHSLCGSVD